MLCTCNYFVSSTRRYHLGEPVPKYCPPRHETSSLRNTCNTRFLTSSNLKDFPPLNTVDSVEYPQCHFQTMFTFRIVEPYVYSYYTTGICVGFTANINLSRQRMHGCPSALDRAPGYLYRPSGAPDRYQRGERQRPRSPKKGKKTPTTASRCSCRSKSVRRTFKLGRSVSTKSNVLPPFAP